MHYKNIFLKRWAGGGGGGSIGRFGRVSFFFYCDLNEECVCVWLMEKGRLFQRDLNRRKISGLSISF